MKKGFTLIELLAVIIILAIVALIATPIVLDVIEDARISAGKSEASIIYSGINDYCDASAMNYLLDRTPDICADGVTIEEVSQMVNLGNAKVLDVVYLNEKILWLQVESNGNIYSLENNEMVLGEGNKDAIDLSGANAPKLYSNMIPVRYDGTNWLYADTSEAWYNYDNKEWANAVVLNNGVTKSVGDTISEDEIALWYVWIPRYKYQLFNANNESVSEQLINIEFENGTATTGTVSCTDSISGSGEVSETCTNATNGNWYTHPAFTFGNEELTGFWVGKFEVSTTDETCNGESNTTNCNKVLPVTIKAGITSFRNVNIYNMFESIKAINSTYSLSGDSHMMKNMEWGAVAYLKQSAYGLGTTDIAINDSSSYITGGGIGTAYKDNIAQSTTGNIYGVYDMSGGALDRTMGNMVDSTGAFYASSSGFESAPEEKYYDKYTYSTDYLTHGRGKLGDATKEILSTFGSNTGGWYSDAATLVYSSHSWFCRGGLYSSGTSAGVFYFTTAYGGAYVYNSSRAVLS